MINIVIGLCLLCLGIAGVLTNWWAVVDFTVVVIPALLLVVGIFWILAGFDNQRRRVNKS